MRNRSFPILQYIYIQGISPNSAILYYFLICYDTKKYFKRKLLYFTGEVGYESEDHLRVISF